MSLYSPQLCFCNACGKAINEPFPQIPGGKFLGYRVCSSACVREIRWRETLSIMGTEYYPDPEPYDKKQALKTSLENKEKHMIERSGSESDLAFAYRLCAKLASDLDAGDLSSIETISEHLETLDAIKINIGNERIVRHNLDDIGFDCIRVSRVIDKWLNNILCQ